MTKLFPIILIVLQACAGVVCALQADWKMALYWVAAAVLNVAVII